MGGSSTYRSSYNDSEYRSAKRYRERNYSNPTPWNNTVVNIDVPDDIVVLTRDPSPCVRCAAAGPCSHRPWEAAAA